MTTGETVARQEIPLVSFEKFAGYWAEQYVGDNLEQPADTLDEIVGNMSPDELVKFGRLVGSLGQSEYEISEDCDFHITPFAVEPATLQVRDGKVYAAVGSAEHFLGVLFRLAQVPDGAFDEAIAGIDFGEEDDVEFVHEYPVTPDEPLPSIEPATRQRLQDGMLSRIVQLLDEGPGWYTSVSLEKAFEDLAGRAVQDTPEEDLLAMALLLQEDFKMELDYRCVLLLFEPLYVYPETEEVIDGKATVVSRAQSAATWYEGDKLYASVADSSSLADYIGKYARDDPEGFHDRLWDIFDAASAKQGLSHEDSEAAWYELLAKLG